MTPLPRTTAVMFCPRRCSSDRLQGAAPLGQPLGGDAAAGWAGVFAGLEHRQFALRAAHRPLHGAGDVAALAHRASEPALISDALDRHPAGLDFADALHTTQAAGMPFLTLDRKLLRKAGRLGLKAQSPRDSGPAVAATGSPADRWPRAS